jgi:hypothetical protein
LGLCFKAKAKEVCFPGRDVVHMFQKQKTRALRTVLFRPRLARLGPVHQPRRFSLCHIKRFSWPFKGAICSILCGNRSQFGCDARLKRA